MIGSIPRACTFAGLAASSAAVAHGGPAALGDLRWMAAALGGAGLAALALWQGWRLVVASGRPQSAASLAALIPAMLAAQAAAHLALLAAGAPAHPGAHGSLALHIALAVVASVLVQRIELRTQRRAAAAAFRPAELVADRAQRAPERPAPVGVFPGIRRGRAPPLPA